MRRLGGGRVRPARAGAAVAAAPRTSARPRPPREPGWREPWMTPTRMAGIVAVLVAAYAALSMIRALRGVLITLVLALFLAFAMEPAVQWLAKRGMRRGVATALVFLAVLVAGIAVVAAIVPLIVDQVNAVIRSIPRDVAQVNELLARIPFVDFQLEATADLREEVQRLSEQFSGQIQTVLLGAASNALSIGATVLGGVVQVLTIGLVTFYLVADGPRWRQALARPLPERRQRELLAIWEVAVEKTGGYISSRVALAACASVATAVALLAIGVPYPLPLGLWVGITGAFIPVVGTYLGGILAILVALTNEPLDALWVLIFVIVYQQVDNYLIGPRLQSQALDLHPAIAFISVIVGGTLLGAIGALLALPAAAILQALMSTYLDRNEVIAELIAQEETDADADEARAGDTPAPTTPAAGAAKEDDTP